MCCHIQFNNVFKNGFMKDLHKIDDWDPLFSFTDFKPASILIVFSTNDLPCCSNVDVLCAIVHH